MRLSSAFKSGVAGLFYSAVVSAVVSAGSANAARIAAANRAPDVVANAARIAAANRAPDVVANAARIAAANRAPDVVANVVEFT